MRARNHEARAAGEAGREDIDWTQRQESRDAFLVIENQRRMLAARVQAGGGSRRDRYRDLVLVAKLVALEYEHLSGRGAGSAGGSARIHRPGPGRDVPADWAQPWGITAMFELRASFSDYSRRRDQLARRLSQKVRDEAEAEAERELSRIRTASRLPVAGAEPEARVAGTPPPRVRKRARTGSPRRSSGRAGAGREHRRSFAVPRPGAVARRRVLVGATALAGALAVGAAYTALRGGDAGEGTQLAAGASVPERPLPLIASEPDKPRDPKPKKAPRPKPQPVERPQRSPAATEEPEIEDTTLPVAEAPPPAPAPTAAKDPAPPAPPKPAAPKPPKPTPPSSQPAPAPAPAPLPAPAPAPAPRNG